MRGWAPGSSELRSRSQGSVGAAHLDKRRHPCFPGERTKRCLIVHLVRDVGQRKRSDERTEKVPQAARELAAHVDAPARPAPVSPLGDQERRVLRLLAQEKSPEDVAVELGITPRTLRNHIHQVNQNLQTHNRLEAVTHALPRLPFCHPVLKDQRPLPPAYPKSVKTLGDIVGRRRLEQGLWQ